MTNIESKVRAIVIPSGNPEWNRERMETAIEINRKRSLNVPYIISGIGPDMNDVLFGDSTRDGLDFHQDLYDDMMEETEPNGIFGVDILSIDSIGNILNTFPPSVSGRYVIVSYPLHLRRLKRIVEKAKKEGKVSQDLDLEYVPTSRFSSPKQIFYETAITIIKSLQGLRF